MKKALLATDLLFVAILVSGCATIATGKYQNVHVTSEPPGAKVRADNGMSITTPGSFDLLRIQNHTLVAEYPGAEPQQKEIKHGVQGWFWGNILLGGIIGGVVDVASGSCDKLFPAEVHFDFTSTGVAAANRKRTYLDAHPNTTEQVRLAILNELSTKGMTKEELQASLGSPDQVVDEQQYEKFIYNNRKLKYYYFKNGTLEKVE